MSPLSSRKYMRHWFGRLPSLPESAFRRADRGTVELMKLDEVVVHVMDHLARLHHLLRNRPATLARG